MTEPTDARSRHSYLKIASFVLSFFPGLFLVGAYSLILLLLSTQPPYTDETGYAFLMLFLLFIIIPSELLALGLGVAGAFQRSCKRTLAVFGVACSVFFLALIESQVGFLNVGSLLIGMTEGQLVVHSPGGK